MNIALAALALLTATVAISQITKPQASGWVMCTEGGSISYDSDSWTIAHSCDMPFQLLSKKGRIDRLSFAEYDHLQKLRQAVKDAEVEIAKAHGVDFGYADLSLHQARLAGVKKTAMCLDVNGYIPADHYEFRGQFLLVNVPEPQ